MAAPTEYGTVSTDYYKHEFATEEEMPTRASGWLMYAAVMLGLAATYNVINGILAVANSKVFTKNASYVFSDLRTWGWIVLGLGILEGFAAFGVLSRSTFARWFGIAVAGLNGWAQLAFVHAYPMWALSLFAMDMLVIYALAVHGGRRKGAA